MEGAVWVAAVVGDMGVTLEHLRSVMDASKYPCEVLGGCEDALVLFAAGFYGAQDAIHIANAGLTATCVDIDPEKLAAMSDAYPEGWEYVTADVFEFATSALADRQWDVVSLDCPSQLFARCEELLPLWCLLARKAVVLGSGSGHLGVKAPLGWRWRESVWRSNYLDGVYWTVLEVDE